MAKIDEEYHKLLNKILSEGFRYEDTNRKGVHRLQIPSYTIKHDFKDGFPAITTKKLYWKGVVGELLWFLRGHTNIKYLVDNGINIWNKDAENFSKNGDLGRVYGAQWRKWGKPSYEINNGYDSHVDQISNLIKGLRENPMGTRHIVTAWNPSELDNMALPPCHWSFEILVEPNYNGRILNKYSSGRLNLPDYQFTLKWHQRSVDTFLGLPFNIASYAMLAKIIGELTNMVPKGIIGDLSNIHIYEPHLDAVKEQLSRDVNKYTNCRLNLSYDFQRNLDIYNKDNILDDFLYTCEIDDFELSDYQSYSRIPAKMLAYS